MWVVAEALALEWEGERVGIWLSMSEYTVWVVAEALALALKWRAEKVGIQLCVSEYTG